MSNYFDSDPELWAKVLSLTTKLLCLRSKFDFSVTSWFRSEAHNVEVGGLPKSLHLTGLAVDVVLDSAFTTDLFRSYCKSIGVYVYDEGDHLHLYERSNI